MNQFETIRKNMVNCQLLPNAITSEGVIEAFSEMPREEFVPEAQKAQAYIDRDLAIDLGDDASNGRFILDPLVQAKLIQAANVLPSDIVLDVACGAGFSTAILSKLANMVVGVEADEKMAEFATQNIEKQEIENAVIINDPLVDGYAKEAPYDVIIINGLVEQVPEILLDQLNENGRLIAVLGEASSINAPLGHAHIFHKVDGIVSKRMLFDACPSKLNAFNQKKEFAL